MDRPTFFWHDQPVRAAGVLFYKKTKRNDIVVLIQSTNKNGFEDLGGKTDVLDENVFDTVVREVAEETNQIINNNCTRRELMKCQDFIYCERSKYLLFIVPANSYVCRVQQAMFSTVENHTDRERTITWIPFRKLFYSQHHDRLHYIKNNILTVLYSKIN